MQQQQLAAAVNSSRNYRGANQVLQCCCAQQQGGEQHAHPEMGLPKQGAPGNIAESLHGRLQPQQEQASCTGGGAKKALPDHPGRQQRLKLNTTLK